MCIISSHKPSYHSAFPILFLILVTVSTSDICSSHLDAEKPPKMILFTIIFATSFFVVKQTQGALALNLTEITDQHHYLARKKKLQLKLHANLFPNLDYLLKR